MKNFFDALKKKLMSGASGPQPARDWLIMLGGTLILIATSVMWNTWFFDRIADADLSIEQAAESALKTYPAGAIQELFKSRAETEAAYRSSFPFIDPSR